MKLYKCICIGCLVITKHSWTQVGIQILRGGETLHAIPSILQNNSWTMIWLMALVFWNIIYSLIKYTIFSRGCCFPSGSLKLCSTYFSISYFSLFPLHPWHRVQVGVYFHHCIIFHCGNTSQFICTTDDHVGCFQLFYCYCFR